MDSYKLNISYENKSVVNIPSELLCSKSIEKFGNEIRLIWNLYILKNENTWERIQEDERNGIIYSEINTQNLKSLTSKIDSDFLQNLLNKDAYFDINELDSEYKYSLTISLESDNNVYGARGLIWSYVNVVAFILRANKWTHDTDALWNYKQWTVFEFQKGYLELENV